MKPRFVKTDCGNLIQASRPWQRISVDFKGPLPITKDGNEHLLIIVDEFSRFPFAVPCKDTTSDSVIAALTQIFAIFGLPDDLHSDRGTSFTSGKM